jgi:hypothetical protein
MSGETCFLKGGCFALQILSWVGRDRFSAKLKIYPYQPSIACKVPFIANVVKHFYFFNRTPMIFK